jgi:hypothetical protein
MKGWGRGREGGRVGRNELVEGHGGREERKNEKTEGTFCLEVEKTIFTFSGVRKKANWEI